MAFLLLLVNLSFYYGINAIFSNISISSKIGSNVSEVVGLIKNIAFIQSQLRTYFVPISAFVFALAGFFLWLSLRNTLGSLLKKNASAHPTAKATAASAPAFDPKVKLMEDQRLFLHLLSVLQREGRLVDFFSENLNLYEDAQIGAAVRSIHDQCKKALHKYLSLCAVMDHNEGTEVTIPRDFNPAAIKLTGNVTGEPPFTGMLRHRGWQVSKIELPTFTSGEDCKIIAPAEVEIS